MFNRKGGLSVIRISIIVAIVGIVLVAGAAITYLTDQAAARSPLDIPAYPKAVYWGTKNVQTTSREVYYRVADTPEAVANYYQQQMNQHYGNSDQTCVRLPASGNAPGSDTDPSIVPYLFRCIFDNSGLNTFQYTQVDIYPGESNPDPFLNAAGMTVVHYTEQWQS
ncbi:MAG TPA: hypothetical protein VHD90_24535 [Phototrophicaceae bacterium]|nr:hypothetical protein [Phototrophicaceae bacterium]